MIYFIAGAILLLYFSQEIKDYFSTPVVTLLRIALKVPLENLDGILSKDKCHFKVTEGEYNSTNIVIYWNDTGRIVLKVYADMDVQFDDNKQPIPMPELLTNAWERVTAWYVLRKMYIRTKQNERSELLKNIGNDL